ncbi:unnamed protein product [Effrenium voratum]|nr:unnamed protein product [Effrenium voratum]
MEKSIAKGKAFVQWYTHPIPDEAAPGDSNGVDDGGKPKEMNFDNVQYLAVEETIAFLDKHFAASPTDIIVAFSQAGTMLALYADALRKAQRPIPWRLSVLVCGSMIDDPRYALQEPLDHAALYIHGGDADPWGRHGERMVPKMYRELEMLEHEDGHGFPASHPRAQEIYQRLLQRMYMSVTDLLER